ncbi:GNAT family N-acetyltransferase [Radiobacillus deserti]|uniref:GNAT family N-acetyltransferase n=1 Tax=Radiobacillus deserti TaxID=2594883 RepID=UPI001E2D9D6A|nr:GNAT family protein [Radiobacillus deserti]
MRHIIDEEVSLRMFTEDDIEEFYNLLNNSKQHLKKWITWVDSVKNKEDAGKSIKLKIEGLVENGGYPTWFAIINEGKIAGTIGFNDIDKTNRVGELGYWLGKNFQQKGIMSRAFKAVIDYGFTELGLNRIEVYIAAGNRRSRALPERFGFLKEGIIRQAEWLYNHFEDEIIYGLLAEDWK